MFFGSVYTTPASPLIRVLKCPVNTAVALNVLAMLAPAAIGFPAFANYRRNLKSQSQSQSFQALINTCKSANYSFIRERGKFMPAKFSSAWWKKNKAKTMLDSGDKVLKALKAYEKVPTPAGPEGVRNLIDAVRAVDQAAAKLMVAKTTSTKLHKESIGYLKEYQAFAEKLGKAGSKVIPAMKKIEAMQLDDVMKIKDFENFCKKEFASEVFKFEKLMKLTKDGGNQAIYDEFIKVGSKFEINISGALRSKFVAIDEADGTGSKWVAAPWKKVAQENRKLLATNKLTNWKASQQEKLAATLPI